LERCKGNYSGRGKGEEGERRGEEGRGREVDVGRDGK